MNQNVWIKYDLWIIYTIHHVPKVEQTQAVPIVQWEFIPKWEHTHIHSLLTYLII